MTADEILLIQNLSRAKFQPRSWDKTFARDLAIMASTTPDKVLTENQRRCLFRQVHRYRKSIDKVYVELARKLELEQFPPADQQTGVMDAPPGLPHSNYVSQLSLPG